MPAHSPVTGIGFPLWPVALGLVALGFPACDPTKPEDTAPEADADTDVDADTDADADGDTDTDTDTDTDADADTDADTDTDADADPPVEDCADGIDNDGDGLADCEDGDCLDTCLEDCADGIDNDRDGATDCDDDECAGATGCPVDYTFVLTSRLDAILLAWGGYITTYTGYDAASAFSGYVQAIGYPDDPAAGEIVCAGYLEAYPSAMYGYGKGTTYVGGYTAGAGDYVFDVAVDLPSHTIEWYDRCPLKALDLGTFAFTRGVPTVYRQDSTGAWALQYSVADPLRDFYYYYRTRPAPHGYQRMYGPIQESPLTWRATYLPP